MALRTRVSGKEGRQGVRGLVVVWQQHDSQPTTPIIASTNSRRGHGGPRPRFPLVANLIITFLRGAGVKNDPVRTKLGSHVTREQARRPEPTGVFPLPSLDLYMLQHRECSCK
jgi:hypothetical protein